MRRIKPGHPVVDALFVSILGELGKLGKQDDVSADHVRRSPSAARRHVATARPAPERNPQLAHLSLARLRSYRRSLLAEELRTSYWRRLVQARRDLLRAGVAAGDRAALHDALTEARSAGGRHATVSLHPAAGLPVLPRLATLWASLSYASDDEAQRAHLAARLASAESVLSAYRDALHERLDRATAELVARYHEDPRACLAALPVEGGAPRP